MAPASALGRKSSELYALPDNPNFIEIHRSDGNEAHWPTKRDEERVVQSGWHPIAHDTPKDIRWRRRRVQPAFSDPDSHILKTWPTGYRLFEKARLDDVEARSDVELFGFAHKFRSPEACILHMHALYSGEECLRCRHLSSTHRDSLAVIAAGPSTADDGAAPLPPTYSWGDLVWVSLSDSLLRQSTNPIKFWPAFVLMLNSGTLRVWIPQFPEAIPVTEDVAGAVSSSRAKYLWFEDAKKFQAALLTILRVSSHGGGSFKNNKDKEELGLWFGSEKLLPGHILRLNVKRKDLNVPHSLSSHESENTDSIVFFRVESVVCDGPVPRLAGDIYELVNDTAPATEHCISGKYIHRLMDHPLLRDCSLAQLGCIAALEGLILPVHDSNSRVFHCGDVGRSEMLLEAAKHALEMSNDRGE
ncbi:hypothetical protein CPB85DRAFT_1276397 [Mucidula mucida]|nr:hypothetical protein CPB85DRAFT_1276397 [Mucidula mucida]